MAEYTTYTPDEGSVIFPTQISNFILASEAIDTEIENARGGEANLLSKINLKINKAGGTLTGDLTLSGNPSADLHVVPRQYTTNNYLPLTGGTITGILTVGTDVIAVKDAALTDNYIVSADSSGRITSSIITTNLALLSGAQAFTEAKTFDAIPAFNGGASGATAPFTIDSTFVVSNLNADQLDGQESTWYASIASAAFTGTPSLPTGTTGITQTVTDDTTKIATTAFVQDVYDQIEVVKTWAGAYQLGTDLNITTVGISDLTTLNSTDIAFADSTNDELRTYRFNGSTWSLVGTGFAIATCGNPALAALNSTDIAFIDDTNDELRTYRFNGSTWSLVGTGLSVTGNYFNLTTLNETDIAFIDDFNDELRTYRWNDGTETWSQVGTGLYMLANAFNGFTALNETDVAIIEETNYELRTYRFNGSTWSLVGTGLSIPTVSTTNLTALNETDVAYIDGSDDELRIYRWNTTTETWSLASTILTLPSSSNQILTTLNGTDIAYIDFTNSDLRTYRFGFTIT